MTDCDMRSGSIQPANHRADNKSSLRSPLPLVAVCGIFLVLAGGAGDVKQRSLSTKHICGKLDGCQPSTQTPPPTQAPPSLHLDAQQQRVVGGLQPPLPVLHLSRPLLLLLQLADVVDRGLQDGAFVPPGLPDGPIRGHASLAHSSTFTHTQI